MSKYKPHIRYLNGCWVCQDSTCIGKSLTPLGAFRMFQVAVMDYLAATGGRSPSQGLEYYASDL